MGGCTAYVKCCMCDDSVGHKHAIRKFEELLVSRIEQNTQCEDLFVLRVSADKQLHFIHLDKALENSVLIVGLQRSRLNVTNSNNTSHC